MAHRLHLPDVWSTAYSGAVAPDRWRLLCRSCRCHTTLTSGTLLDKARTPLTTWFEAAWHVATAKNGLSAKTQERTLGVRDRVAWTMLQRFRVAMVRSERERLAGVVEVDETLVGGAEHGGKRGRGTAKMVVVIAVEVLDPKGFGRLRMRHIADASGENLVPFVSLLSTSTGTWRSLPSASTGAPRRAVDSSSAASWSRRSSPCPSLKPQ